MDSYSDWTTPSNSARLEVFSDWLGAVLFRVMTRRRARHDVRTKTEHESATTAATRDNTIDFILTCRKLENVGLERTRIGGTAIPVPDDTRLTLVSEHAHRGGIQREQAAIRGRQA